MKDILCKMTLNDWGNIGNIVLGIASVFTAIITAIVLCKQYSIQKETLLQQQLSQQPTFNVFYELIDSDNDGKYENEILNISNEGQLFKQIKSIFITTIFDAATNHQHSLLKINGYFYATTLYQNLQGTIYKSRGNNNKERYRNIYDEMMQRSKVGERYYELCQYNLIKIEYIDIHNKNRIVYFKDRICIDESTYSNVIADIINKQDILDIDNITFEDIFINEIR
uniref:hypothetical protein n=1 Tax=Alistipes sp. TaxID=1872444 RepID=UPI0040564557